MAYAQEEPGEPSAPSSVVPQPVDREAQLREAVRLYQLGEFEQALAELAELVVDDSIPGPLRREARVYMAELLLTEGDRDGAELFFRKVLSEDPDLQLDPFRHPPDVMGFFQYVKAKVDAEASEAPVVTVPPPAPVLEPVRPPWTVAVPFGAYHFSQDRPLGGSLWFVAHAGLLSSSAITMSLLLVDNGAPEELPRYETYQRVQRANLVLSGLCAASFVGYYIDVGLHWRRKKASLEARPSVGLAPTPGGAMATTRLTF